MPERGKYFVYEGGEFAGKSTQLELAKEDIKEWGLEDKFLFTREPGGTPTGEEIRKLLFFPPEELTDAAALNLFTTNRLFNWHTQINPALDRGINVVSDRNWYSTLSYQGARGNISEERIIRTTTEVLPKEYIYPDLAFVLTIPTAERVVRQQNTALQDGGLDAFEARDSVFHDKVTDIYHRTVTQMGAVGINGSRSIDEIHTEMKNYFRQALEN